MATIRQTIYAFLTHNPNSLTEDIAKCIKKDMLYTSKTIDSMKRAGIIISEKIEGSKKHVWRVSNRAVKFNTGETVRAKAKRRQSHTVKVRMDIKALRAQLDALEATLES